MSTNSTTAPITYKADTDFHQLVDDLLDAHDIGRRGARDKYVTETLLAAGIWPATWETLMGDNDKAELMARVLKERQQRP